MTIIKKVYNIFNKKQSKQSVPKEKKEKVDKKRSALEKKVLEGANKALTEYKEALEILEEHDKT